MLGAQSIADGFRERHDARTEPREFLGAGAAPSLLFVREQHGVFEVVDLLLARINGASPRRHQYVTVMYATAPVCARKYASQRSARTPKRLR